MPSSQGGLLFKPTICCSVVAKCRLDAAAQTIRLLSLRADLLPSLLLRVHGHMDLNQHWFHLFLSSQVFCEPLPNHADLGYGRFILNLFVLNTKWI